MTERPSAFAVDRRGFIRLAGSTAAGWLALGATPDRMRIVASLTSLSLDDELTRRSMTDAATTRLGGLIAGLRQRGWVEGVNYRFEIRSTFGGPDKFKAAVTELIDLKPDVILTGSTVETAAVLAATKTIPIVSRPQTTLSATASSKASRIPAATLPASPAAPPRWVANGFS
jgi:putative ABC transport system substrate-binding protein